MRTKTGMPSTKLTEEVRQEVLRFAQRGIRLCKGLPTQGGAVFTYLCEHLCRLTVALAAAELRVTHAERELRELREQNAHLEGQLRLARIEMPFGALQEETKVRVVDELKTAPISIPDLTGRR